MTPELRQARIIKSLQALAEHEAGTQPEREQAADEYLVDYVALELSQLLTAGRLKDQRGWWSPNVASLTDLEEGLTAAYEQSDIPKVLLYAAMVLVRGAMDTPAPKPMIQETARQRLQEARDRFQEFLSQPVRATDHAIDATSVWADDLCRLTRGVFRTQRPSDGAPADYPHHFSLDDTVVTVHATSAEDGRWVDANATDIRNRLQAFRECGVLAHNYRLRRTANELGFSLERID